MLNNHEFILLQVKQVMQTLVDLEHVEKKGMIFPLRRFLPNNLIGVSHGHDFFTNAKS